MRAKTSRYVAISAPFTKPPAPDTPTTAPALADPPRSRQHHRQHAEDHTHLHHPAGHGLLGCQSPDPMWALCNVSPDIGRAVDYSGFAGDEMEGHRLADCPFINCCVHPVARSNARQAPPLLPRRSPSMPSPSLPYRQKLDLRQQLFQPRLHP